MLIVCAYCDSVYRVRPLIARQIARCARCHGVLRRASPLSTRELLALTLAAGIVFVIANASPVITITTHGLNNRANLLQAVLAMMHDSEVAVGVLVGVTLFVVPLLQIALLAWVLAFARSGRYAPGFAAAMRLLHFIRPWSMTEVFLLAVLVAIVKLSASVSVVTGAGTYAIVVLTVLVTLIAQRDIRELWELPLA